jgi:BspA type Leucine rich repeat region (6 copies)
VYLDYCDGLSDLSPLVECPLLESVECAGSTRVVDVSVLGACGKLRKFGSTAAGHVNGIEALSKEIEFLDLAGVTNADVSVLSQFSNLRGVRLGFCGQQVPDIRSLGQCTQLRYVEFASWSNVTDVTALGACHHLTHFFSGESFKRILGIGALSSTLQCVQLAYATDEDVQVLGTFPNLREIELWACDNISDVSSLGLCTLLESVKLHQGPAICDVSALVSCPHLKRFENRQGHRLAGIELLSRDLECITLSAVTCEDVKTLATFPLLREMCLYGADRNVPDIHPLAHCPKLESITFMRCLGVIDISALASLRLLRRIQMSYCGLLMSMSALGSCPNLESLVIDSCHAISDISWISSCSRLKSVRITSCSGISDLSALAGCVRLADITLVSCYKNMDLLFINRCANLESIQLSNCPNTPDPISLVGGLGQSIAFRRTKGI